LRLRRRRDDGIVVVMKARRKQEVRPEMTTDEYLTTTPETLYPVELAYGVLRVSESPGVRHQRVVRDLTIALTAFARREDSGEVLPAPMDVVLDYEANLVVQPDVLFVSRDRARIIGRKIEGAPDMVAEVLSPLPRIGAVEEKVSWFARYGVRECWLIHLERRQLVILEFGDGRVIRRSLYDPEQAVQSTVFPGLGLRPADVLGWW
jgi:Uma2 family endonuclease